MRYLGKIEKPTDIVNKQYVDNAIGALSSNSISKQIRSLQTSLTYARFLKRGEDLYLFLDNCFMISKDNGCTFSRKIDITSSTNKEELNLEAGVSSFNSVANATPFLLPDNRIAVYYRCNNTNDGERYASIRMRYIDEDNNVSEPHLIISSITDYGIMEHNDKSIGGLWEPVAMQVDNIEFSYILYYCNSMYEDNSQSVDYLYLDSDGLPFIAKWTEDFMLHPFDALYGTAVSNRDDMNLPRRPGMPSIIEYKSYRYMVVECNDIQHATKINLENNTLKAVSIELYRTEADIEQWEYVTTLFQDHDAVSSGAPYITILSDSRIAISFQSNLEEVTDIDPEVIENPMYSRKFYTYVSKETDGNPEDRTYVQTNIYNFQANEAGYFGSVANINDTLYSVFTRTQHQGENNSRITDVLIITEKAIPETILNVANGKGTYSVVENLSSEANGNFSHSEGFSNINNGTNSHAEGDNNIIENVFSSHAEGTKNKIYSRQSHVEGYNNTVGLIDNIGNNLCIHAEGADNVATGDKSHVEGSHSQALGAVSHVEGGQNVAKGQYSHAEGYGTKTDAIASAAHAEGYYTEALGPYAHSEGYCSKAYNEGHAEGERTIAGYDLLPSHTSFRATHAEGIRTNALRAAAHAEGIDSRALGIGAHAQGNYTIATGAYQSVLGAYNEIDFGSSSYTYKGAYSSNVNYLINQAVLFNGELFVCVKSHSNQSPIITTDNEEVVNTTYWKHWVASNGNEKTEYAHIIGNGTTNSVAGRRNIHTIDWNGSAWYNAAVQSTGADYAEYFEWADGNPNAEERIGHFVSLKGNKIVIANETSDIIGVVSAAPAIIGDSYESQWHGKYLTDIYGRVIYEDKEVEYEDITVDEEGNELITKYPVIESIPKLNPDYDESNEYIPRSKRPEWATIGFLGKLVVIDDGSCVVGGRCSCNQSGVATNGTEYRVLERLDDAHIQILANFL